MTVASPAVAGAAAGIPIKNPTPTNDSPHIKTTPSGRQTATAWHEVNVEFADGQGGTLSIGRVDDPSQCSMVSDGWYYDDPQAPTRIITCAQTCETIQGFAMASISIQFGSATIPAG